ncbi:MAG: peroxiredoxin family protein [Armatimonadota bacterium]
MAVAQAPKLKLKTMIPVFHLNSTDSRTINLWNYKGLQNLMLAFFPDIRCEECMDFLRNTVDSFRRYEEEFAIPLIVIRGGKDKAEALSKDLNPPFPILYDEDGKVTDQYTDTLPAVFAADRFGELYAEWIVGEDHAFPSQKDILDVIELINLECPECGAPLDWR